MHEPSGNVELDRSDILLLRALQQDGRLTNQELSQHVHLSDTVCSRRRRALEKAGVILGYHALLDPVRVGYSESVFVTIKLHADSHDDIAAFEEAVQGIDEVMECYAVAGQLDFLLHVVAQDTPHYERIRDRLARLPGIERLDSALTMHTVVRRTTLPLPPGSSTRGRQS